MSDMYEFLVLNDPEDKRAANTEETEKTFAARTSWIASQAEKVGEW